MYDTLLEVKVHINEREKLRCGKTITMKETAHTQDENRKDFNEWTKVVT